MNRYFVGRYAGHPSGKNYLARFAPCFTWWHGVIALSLIHSPASAANLPIEVFASDGATLIETVTVDVPGSTLGATHLWLQIHSLSYQAKASVQVNGGAWIALSNATPGLLVAEPGKRMGGIGGAFSTLKITVELPAGLVVNGAANTVRFRFNVTDGISMGFRVLAFNFLDIDGHRLLPESAFTNDDPATWQPPLNTPADIAAGENLWRTQELIDSPLTGQILLARCTDCHAQDGRDLKYFNFSNYSIIQRSKFHGLSQTEGEQIASYIRSLAVTQAGRPWNPPYQPGPGLTAKPVSAWAAGAGIEWALDRDRDTQAYLPGSGTDRDALVDGTRIKSRSLHDTPIALQLLDWNHWLPRIHPKDAVGTNSFTGDVTWTKYVRLRDGLSGNLGVAPTAYIYGGMRADFEQWATSISGSEASALWKNFAQVAGEYSNGGVPISDKELVDKKYAFAVWFAVKQWELMQEFDLEGRGRQFYGAYARERAWFTNRHIFNISPHILGFLSGSAVSGDGNGLLTNAFFANVWYETQQQLNSGARNAVTGGFHTVDWAYSFGLMGNLASASGFGEPLRAANFTLNSMEQGDSGYGPDGRNKNTFDNPWYGWDLRDNVADSLRAVSDNWAEHPDPSPLVQTTYQVWMEKNGTYPVDRWVKGLGHASVETFYRPPANYIFAVPLNKLNWPDGLALDIGTLRSKFALHEAVFTAMADFGKALWANNDWDQFKVVSPTTINAPANLAGAVATERVQLTWSPVVGALSYNVKRADSASGPFMAVRLLTPQTSFTDRDLEPGRTYYYRVSANSARYEGTQSAAISATPTSGLVARWRFDEANGDMALDATATANHGTLISDPTRAAGHLGSGLTFNGSTQFVSVPQSLHQWLGRSATMSFWVKTTAVGNTGNTVTNPQVIGASDDSAFHQHWGVLDSGGRIGLAVRNGGGSFLSVYSTESVNDGQWHHVAISRDTATGAALVYLDGVLSKTGAVSAGIQYAPRLRDIGRGTNFNTSFAYWNGSLDEIGIYDRVLSASEVTAIYNETLPPPPPANIAPVAATDTAVTEESTSVFLNVLANDSDTDEGPQPLFIQSLTQPAKGSATIVAGLVRYTPNGGFFGGQDTFNYTISDGDLTATASITVTVNQTSTAANLSAAGLTGSAVGSGSGSSRVLADGTWEVNGLGVGAAGSADHFWLENRAQTGGFQVRARLRSLTGASDARAGVMLREGTGADARFVQVCATPAASARFHSRTTTSGIASAEQAAPVQNQYAFPNKWLLLQRIGNEVSIRIDDDNNSYTELTRVTLSGLSTTLQIGLFTSGGSSATPARAVFSNFEVTVISGWDGGAGTQNWSDANNWDPNAVPTATGIFNVAISSGSGFIVKQNTAQSGSPEDTGSRLGSITIGADATLLRSGQQDFFTGRNLSAGVPRSTGVVTNAGTMRNETTNTTWLYRWSPVAHANSGTIEARNANAIVKFEFGTASLANAGGILKSTLGGKMQFAGSLVVSDGAVSTDGTSQIETIGDNRCADFTNVQITNAGTWLHQQASTATNGRTNLSIFNGSTRFVNTGTFRIRQAMTSSDANAQTALVELRGAAEFVNQPGANVIISAESTATTPLTAGDRIARFDLPETSPLFTNLGTVTITDTLATTGLKARAELRSTAPLINQGQITVTGARSFLTVNSAEPYRQTAGATILGSGATLTAPSTTIEGGTLGGSGKVTGDIEFAASGAFASFLASNATSNLVEVTGMVRLDGTLQIGTDAGYIPAAGTEFRIMNATGGFAGSFAAVPQFYRVIVQGTDLILQRDSPPTIAQAAAASPNIVTGTTTQLSVLGQDDGGEENLTYTWQLIGTPPGSVTFSVNGTNVSKTTVATFGGPGTYQFQVTVRDQSTLNAINTVGVTVQGNVSLWRNIHFNLGELSQPAVSGLMSDADFDGIVNLLEYALGLDPRVRDPASGLPIMDTATGYLRLTFIRPRPAPGDVTYEVEVNGSLAPGSWGTVPFDGPPTENGDGTETLSARDTVPTGIGPRFIRLSVRIPGS